MDSYLRLTTNEKERLVVIRYTISGVEFKNKVQITKFIRNIVSKYKIGSYLDKDDFIFMCALLEYHPGKEKKIGCGIEKIVLRSNMYNTVGFMIVREDDTEVDFSWVKIVNKYLNNKTEESKRYDYEMSSFVKACREVVFDDIRRFKVNYFRVNGEDGVAPCQETGEMISYSDAHVHHSIIHFKQIVDEWVKTFSVNIFNIEIGGYEDMSDTHYFVDKDIEQCFRDFHNLKATLRVVCKEVHNSRLK